MMFNTTHSGRHEQSDNADSPRFGIRIKHISYLATLVVLVIGLALTSATTAVADEALTDVDLGALSITDQYGYAVDIGTFDPDVGSYSADVHRTIDWVTVSAVALFEGDGRVDILPLDARPGVSGHQVDLSHGRNMIIIGMTSFNNGGWNKTYSVEINRAGGALDSAVSEVSVSGLRVDYEGNTIPYLLTRTGDTAQALTVSYDVTETGGEMVPASLEGRFDVEFPAGHASARLDLETEGDAEWEEHSTVTVSLVDGNGYDVRSTSGNASTKMRDDDFPEATAVLTVTPNQAVEGGQVRATVTVTTNGPQKPHGLGAWHIELRTMPGTADPDDFVASTSWGSYGILSVEESFFTPVMTNGVVTAYESSYSMTISIVDDDYREEAETFSVLMVQVESVWDSKTLTLDSSSTPRTVTIAADEDAVALTALTVSGTAATDYPENGDSLIDTYSVSESGYNTIEWSLLGEDSGYFSISSSGALRFNSPPDYESPWDANWDNVYQVSVRASAGTGIIGTLGVTVTVTDEDGEEDSEGIASYVEVERVGATEPGDTYTVTWNDQYTCSTNYNAYLEVISKAFLGDQPIDPIHLGSAAPDGTQITHRLTESLERSYGHGFEVRLYCGTDSGRLVSKVLIPPGSLFQVENPLPVTHSSKQPLTGLTVSPGTLKPAFNRDIEHFRYYVDVANDVSQISVTATAEPGYPIYMMRAYSSFRNGHLVPNIMLIDIYGPTILTDADTETDGFQINLDEGDNVIGVYLNNQGGGLYRLTVTRAAGTPALTVSGATTLDYAENGVGTVAGYTTSGTQGAVTWSLSGDDSGDFSISSAGELAFTAAPDYEAPADADTDNVYQVTVEATDGTNNATLDVTVTVTDVTGICDRTPQIQDGILALLSGVNDCELVTDTHLAGITGNLVLAKKGITALKSGDFAGLSNLDRLDLIDNSLEGLPSDIFDGLASLTGLQMENNSIKSLPSDIFEDLEKLTSLHFQNNDLAELPEDVFDDVPGLATLYLTGNDLAVLPADIFDGLSNMGVLHLHGNGMTELPADIFDGLSKLLALRLNSNALEELPAGVFAGLTKLNTLNVSSNPGAPFTLTAELEQQGDDAVVVKVAEGAPFDLTVQMWASGGTLDGDVLSRTSVTVPAGSLASAPVTVSVSGSQPQYVTVGIRDPSFPPPANNTVGGIALAVGSTVFMTITPPPMRVQLDMAPSVPKNTKPTGTRTATGTVTVEPGTPITVTMSFHGLEQDSNQNDIDYIFRADVLDSNSADADACEDQAGGYGLGVDRYMRQVDEDPEVRRGAISADCPAGSYTLRASLLSPDSVELATSSAAFTVGDPPASTDATLSGLTLSGVNFGTFASATTNYTTNVGNDVEQTTVTATANDDGATYVVKLDGAEDADGTVDLAVGANVITVEVTAADEQTTKTYTVTVTRAAPSSTDATLSSLSLWPGELVPAFDPAVTDYRAGIGDRSNVTVYAKANHSGATVSITPADADTDRYGHQVAANTVTTITITAEDGQTTQDYTMKVGCDGIWCGVVKDDDSIRSAIIGYNLYDSDTSITDRYFTFDGNHYELQTTQLVAESKHLVLEFPMDTFGELAKMGTRARLTLEVDGEKFFLADTALKFFYGLFTDAIIWEQDTGLQWQKGVPIWLSLLEEGAQDATGKPTISGTAEWGQTLTASAAGIGDPDGLQSPPGFKYQWLRDDFDIPEANESTYEVKGADVGSALKVAVTFFDAAGNPQVVISDATAQVPTPACNVLWCALLTPGGKGQPEERGLRRGWDEGNFINHDALTDSDFTYATESYAVSDLYVFDGDVNDLNIEFTPGSHGSIDQQSTRNKLTLYVEDVPFPLSDAAYAAEVTYSDRSSTPPSSHQVKWTNVDLEWNLVNLGAPWGKAEKVWLRMEATPASDDATLNGLTLSGVDIGAFDPATTKYAAEVNHDVTETTVTVTVNDGGATYAAKLDGVADADGTLSLAEGSNVITIEVTAEDGDTTQTYTVTVTRAGPPLTARFEEAPATHNGTDPLTFRIAFSEDIDTSYVTVRDHALEVTGGSVTAAWRVESRSDLWGIRVQPDSDADVEIALPANRACDAQGAVCTDDDKVLSNRPEMTIPGPTPANTPATGAPAITGTAQVGQTLTASTSGIADADGLTNATFSYQWIASDGSTDTDISGATAATYTLMDADEGKTVKVRVTFTDDGGNEESLTSAATGLVATPPSNDATLSSLTLSGINFGTFDSATTAYTASVANDVTETTVTPTVNDGGATYAVKLDGVEDADGVIPLAVGDNVITVEVTAEDEQTTKTYRVTVTRAEEQPSSNPAPQLTARFEEAPSAHDGTAPFTLHIAFSEDISTSYVTIRDHALEVTSGSVTAAWRVDSRNDLWGVRVQPDSDADVEIALPANRACDTQGAVCTADDKVLSNRPEMTVPGPAPANAPVNSPATGAPVISGTVQVGQTLTASTSGIADSDGLSNAVFAYQWVASDGTTDMDISGATSATYTLADADQGKTVKVRVTFTDDGGNEELLISAATTAVAPPPSDDATLSGLSLSGVNIGTFAPDTTDYTANVGNDVTETTVTATANDGGATYVIKLYGTEDVDGTVDLAVGANTVSVLVTAEDGNTAKTYRVTVTRAGAEEEPPPSDDATLSALALSGVNFGTFNSVTTAYTASVAHEVTETTVTATVNDGGTSYVVKLGGSTDSDGVVSLSVGSNAITVEVTAEDDSTTKTYTVTVTRAAPPPSDDATLSALTLSGIDIGSFAPDTTNYTASVGNDVEQTTVTATVSDDGASYVVKLDGAEDADGTVGLAVGDNAVSVVVTAEDGNTTRTYTVTVTRAEADEESAPGGPQGPPGNFTGEVIGKGRVALDWDDVAGATEYQVQLWTPTEQLVLPNGDIGIVFDGSSATVSGLPDYASWSFKVSASGDWSPGWLTLENPYH